MDQVVSNALKRVYLQGYSSACPDVQGKAGINELNMLLQDIMNPPKEKRRELKFGDVVYRTGDKILQLVNQPENNVFNGDIGEIVSIFMPKKIRKKKTWSSSHLTATKSPLRKRISASLPTRTAVPFISRRERIPDCRPACRQRLLSNAQEKSALYRHNKGEKFLILCGEEEALEWGVKNNDATVRQTSLKNRLTEQTEEMDAELAALQKERRSVYMMRTSEWKASRRLTLWKKKRK